MEQYPGYLGILKWSLAQSDGTGETKVAPLTDEEKAFLTSAIEEMTVDVNAVARACIKIIKLPDNPANDPPADASGDATAEAGGSGTGGGAGAGAGATGSGAGAGTAAVAPLALGGSAAPLLAPESPATEPGATAAEAAAPVAGEDTPGADSAGVTSAADETGAAPAAADGEAGSAPCTTVAVAGAATPPTRPPVTIDERRKQKLEALESLLDYVHQIDAANNMISMGGMTPLVATLRSRHEDLRASAAEVLAMTVQNNPKTQLVALAEGTLDTCMRLLTADTPAVQRKALLCISCLVAESPVAQDAFAKRNGWAAIVAAYGSPQLKLQRKAVFFTLHMVASERQAAAAAEAGAVEALTAFVGHDDIDLREHSQQALLHMLRSSDVLATATRASGAGLIAALRAREATVSTLLDDPEESEYFTEEHRVLSSLLEILAPAAGSA